MFILIIVKYILYYYTIIFYSIIISRLNLIELLYSFASHTERDNYANVILKMLDTNCT